MKEFVDIHDFLVSEQVVGDWDGQETLVAEKLNEFYHTMYQLADDDIDTELLTQLLEVIWHHWIGQPELADIEPDEIYDWCNHVLLNPHQYISD